MSAEARLVCLFVSVHGFWLVMLRWGGSLCDGASTGCDVTFTIHTHTNSLFLSLVLSLCIYPSSLLISCPRPRPYSGFSWLSAVNHTRVHVGTTHAWNKQALWCFKLPWSDWQTVGHTGRDRNMCLCVCNNRYKWHHRCRSVFWCLLDGRYTESYNSKHDQSHFLCQPNSFFINCDPYSDPRK